MSTISRWNSLEVEGGMRRKQGTPLSYFLVFASVLFIGILVFCYVVTKRANPVLVDVHGKPVSESSAPAHR